MERSRNQNAAPVRAKIVRTWNAVVLRAADVINQPMDYSIKCRARDRLRAFNVKIKQSDAKARAVTLEVIPRSVQGS